MQCQYDVIKQVKIREWEIQVLQFFKISAALTVLVYVAQPN